MAQRMISVYRCDLARGKEATTHFLLVTRKDEVRKTTTGWRVRSMERIAGGKNVRVSAFLLEGLGDRNSRFLRSARLYRTQGDARKCTVVIARNTEEMKGTLGKRRVAQHEPGTVVITPAAKLALRRRASAQ